jgi:hypothetical protein
MRLHDRSTDKKKIDLIRWANRQRRFPARIRPARIGEIGVVDDALSASSSLDEPARAGIHDNLVTPRSTAK